MNVPSNLKYTRDHEWVLLEGNVATVGITDFAQNNLGDVVFVDIPTVGEKLEAEDSFGSIESVKSVSDMFMPVAGKITEVNEELEGSPELLNSDPYGDGWIVKVTVNNPKDVDKLLSPADYQKLISQ